MSLQEITRTIVEDFLQTVVVVDDNAYLYRAECERCSNGNTGLPEIIPTILHTPLTPVAANSFDSIEEVEAITPPQVHLLNAKVLIDAFANKGLVCAVLRPESDEINLESEDENLIYSKTYKSAKCADLLVLDWQIHGNYGDVTKKIINKIVAEDIQNGRLRFIAIYTGEPRLTDYITEVTTALNADENIHADAILNIEAFEISCGPAIITIFGKLESVVGGISADEENRFVSIENLPDSLIKAFTTKHSGLLPNVALSSIAAIRKNTHRVLNKYKASLDPAYLTHRALIHPTDEAERHITDFLADELNSILNDEEVGNVAGNLSIKAWIHMNYETGLNLKRSLNIGRRIRKPHKIIEDIFSIGYDKAREKYPTVLNFDKKKLTEKLVNNRGMAEEINKEFAILTTNKTYYRKPKPYLTLGTILKKRTKKGDNSYWLCLQPRCDSVRIQTSRIFPLLALKATSSGEQYQILVEESGTKISLSFKEKAYAMAMVEFLTKTATLSNIASYIRGSNFYFSTVETDASYQWIGQLKSEQAQRIANKISAQFSRVGLNESEWFRLQGPLANNDD